MIYNAIGYVSSPEPGDDADIQVVYQSLAAMFIETLSPFAAKPPIIAHEFPPAQLKEINFPDPEILILPAEAGVKMTPIEFGGTTDAHPGGLVQYQWIIQAFGAVGRSSLESGPLALRTLPWFKYMDAAIRSNTNLEGRVSRLNGVGGRWGELEYAMKAYWGWVINIRVTTEYLRRSG